MRTTLLIALVLGCCLAMTGQQNQRLATLKLLITDYDGDKVSPLDRLSLRDSRGREWKTAFDSSLTAKVPPGYYDLEIDAYSFMSMKPYKGSVAAIFPEVSYVIGMEYALPEGDFATSTVRGRFEQPPPT